MDKTIKLKASDFVQHQGVMDPKERYKFGKRLGVGKLGQVKEV